MTTSTQKTRTIRTGSKPAPKAPETSAAPKMEEPKTKREMANPEPRAVHTGHAPSTFRLGKKLTPLRVDYRCGQMSEKDNEFLKDVINLADKSGKFERRNIDAGRLGRLFTLGFVTYEDTGVVDSKQIISITDKAKDFLKPVKAA